MTIRSTATSLSAVSAVSAVLVLTAAAFAQIAPIKTEIRKIKIDSGYLDNNTAAERVVFQKLLSTPQVYWTRIFFDACNLPKGSRLRLTSTADKAVQLHDGKSILDYGESSCIFNGGSVKLELIAGPWTKANRLNVVHVEVEPILKTYGPQSICGTTDDRKRSFDKRQGRLSVGCTAFLINKRTMLTAGHCTSTSRVYILSFNVPLSTNSGAKQAAHPDDQYAMVANSIRRLDNRFVGSDWAISLLAPNSNTKKLPGEAQGEWYEVGTVPTSTSGQNIRITGYGITTPKNNLNAVQKTHVGPAASIASTVVRYVTDTTGGNSGSPIIHENTGKVIGIHTHGFCTRTSGANAGTRIDRADLRNAIAATLKASGVGAIGAFGTGCKGTSGVPALSATGVADIGQELDFLVLNVPAFKNGLVFLGASNSKDGQVTLPRDLKGFGMPGCSQLVSLDAVVNANSSVSATAFSAKIPFDFSLVGTTVYVQYAIEDSKANAFGVVVSNGLKVEIGK